MKSADKNLLFRFVIILVGLALLAISIAMYVDNSETTYKETEGVITAIIPHHRAGDDIDYSVLVDYTVDGEKYVDREYGSYNFTMKVGDTVTIYYDVDRPAHIKSADSDIMMYIMMAIGAVMVAVTVVIIIKDFVEKRQETDGENPDESMRY